ncbi:large ribosomal subunit protein bL9m [Stigmatopora nigra]
MLSSRCRALHNLLGQMSIRNFSVTPVQNTVVLERWWQVPLAKVGSPPRLNPRRHRIYKLVEDRKHTPKEKMELILTQTVPKLGGRGETVMVKKSLGRNKLLPQGLAVYSSPENKQMFAEEFKRLREGDIHERVQTRTGQLTVEFLKGCKLTIHKMPSEDFKLTSEVVRRRFLRKMSMVVPPHALKLPFEPITELGDYWCEVTVNGLDTIRIPMSLVPYEDMSSRHQRLLRKQRNELKVSQDVDEQAESSQDDASMSPSDHKKTD